MNYIACEADNIKSNSLRMFLNFINSGIVQSNMFYKIGAEEYINKHTVPKDIKFTSDYFFYRALYDYLFSMLEHFFSEFLVESISDDKINNRDELSQYLKTKYNYRYVTYQNLKQVNDYYIKELNIPISSFEGYDILVMKMEQRHINTHNLGFVDDTFLNGNWSYIKRLDEYSGEKTLATKVDENELYQTILLVINLVKYLDDFKKSNELKS